VQQLRGFLDADTYEGGNGATIDGVVVEFVQTGDNPITSRSQILDALSDQGLDLQRLDIRVVNIGDQFDPVFQPVGTAPRGPGRSRR